MLSTNDLNMNIRNLKDANKYHRRVTHEAALTTYKRYFKLYNEQCEVIRNLVDSGDSHAAYYLVQSPIDRALQAYFIVNDLYGYSRYMLTLALNQWASDKRCNFDTGGYKAVLKWRERVNIVYMRLKELDFIYYQIRTFWYGEDAKTATIPYQYETMR